ncbi:MAG: thioredoxin fold domain-containing protein [Puia sp.]|nr:thioredoxin fold domain-containing protein [Puia sp.]
MKIIKARLTNQKWTDGQSARPLNGPSARSLSIFLFVTASLFSVCTLSAQQAAQQPAQGATPTAPPFRRFPTLPPFHLLKLDSASYLTKDDVKKHRQTIVMFFSPDCDHCKHQTEAILAQSDKFKDIEIVMATYQPFEEMKQFNTYYRIFDHPNIKMGRDEKFFLVPFYQIHNLPFLALYDKNGNLITTFEGNQKAETLLNAFQQKS